MRLLLSSITARGYLFHDREGTIQPEIMERTHTGYGVSRYRVKREYYGTTD